MRAPDGYTARDCTHGALYNQVIDGHFYWYQEEWSNDGHTCLQRYTPSASTPTATFTATAGSGLSMSFDATGSTAPGGIADFSWQFNDVNSRPDPGNNRTDDHAHVPVGRFVLDGTGRLQCERAVEWHRRDRHDRAERVHARVHVLAWQADRGSAGDVQRADGRERAAGGQPRCGSSATARPARGRPDARLQRSRAPTRLKAVLFSGVGSAFPGQGAAPITAQQVTVG